MINEHKIFNKNFQKKPFFCGDITSKFNVDAVLISFHNEELKKDQLFLKNHPEIAKKIEDETPAKTSFIRMPIKYFEGSLVLTIMTGLASLIDKKMRIDEMKSEAELIKKNKISKINLDFEKQKKQIKQDQSTVKTNIERQQLSEKFNILEKNKNITLKEIEDIANKKIFKLPPLTKASLIVAPLSVGAIMLTIYYLLWRSSDIVDKKSLKEKRIRDERIKFESNRGLKLSTENVRL